MKAFILNIFLITFYSSGLGFSENSSIEYKRKYTLKISEVCTNNWTVLKDEKGNYSDWIEIYNYGNNIIDLNNIYLTNDPANLTKYQFKTDSNSTKNLLLYKRSYKLIWCDKNTKLSNRHINFKLNAQGTFLAIVAPDGKTIIDSLTVPELHKDISYGKVFPSSRKYYFDSPSPLKINNNGYKEICASPKVKISSGFYNKEQVIHVEGSYLEVNKNEEQLNIYPLSSNNIFFNQNSSSQFNLKDSTCAKSKTIYKSIFINDLHSYPVISISIDTNHIYDKIYGLQSIKNKKKNFSRDAYLEYFDKNGNKKENAHIEIKVQGAFSRTYPQKSLSIKIADDAFKKNFKYPFFSQVDHSKYKSFVLRNSGNDWLNARMKDALIHSLIDQEYLNLNTQAFEPCILYVNGEYWGLYNMREKINSDYLKYHYDVSKKDIEIIEKHNIPIKGDKNSFKTLMKYINQSSFKNKSEFDSLKQLIDIENFIDYYALQIYIGNEDWPQNNVKCWRDKNYDKKWHWIIYDLDEGFKRYNLNSIDLALGLDSARIKKFDSIYVRSTQIFPKMMENDLLKKKFVNRTFDLMNFTFDSSRVAYFIDSLVKVLSPEMKRTLDFWYPQHTLFKKSKSAKNNFFDSWIKNTKRLKSFVKKRNEFLIQDLQERKWIDETIEVKIDFNLDEYDIYINDIQLKENQKPLVYSKNFGIKVKIISKTDKKLIVPKKWIKKQNYYIIKKSGLYQIK